MDQAYDFELCSFGPLVRSRLKQEAKWRKGLGWDVRLTGGKFVDFGDRELRIGTIAVCILYFLCFFFITVFAGHG